MDGWDDPFILGRPMFRGKLAASFREGKKPISHENGTSKPLLLCHPSPGSFFSDTHATPAQFVPRAVFVDTDPSTKNEILTGQNRDFGCRAVGRYLC